jgi:hypothetical protein
MMDRIEYFVLLGLTQHLVKKPLFKLDSRLRGNDANFIFST